jgi:hypothetical protein
MKVINEIKREKELREKQEVALREELIKKHAEDIKKQSNQFKIERNEERYQKKKILKEKDIQNKA